MKDSLAGPITDSHDLSRTPLTELLALADEDSVLGHSLRRMRRELEHPEETIAGFQNRI